MIGDVAPTYGGDFTSGHKSHDVQPQGILLWISPFSCTPWPKLAENRCNGALLLLLERAITITYHLISTTLQVPIISVDSNFNANVTQITVTFQNQLKIIIENNSVLM